MATGRIFGARSARDSSRKGAVAPDGAAARPTVIILAASTISATATSSGTWQRRPRKKQKAAPNALGKADVARMH